MTSFVSNFSIYRTLFLVAALNISLNFSCFSNARPVFGDSLIQVMEIIDSICLDQSTGYIHIELADTINAYQVIWNNGHDGMYLNDLEAGSYSVSVSDASGVVESKQFSISHFPQSDYELVNDSTSCESMTSIRLNTISNNVPIQQLQWSTGDITPMLEDISHGHYSVQLTDMYNCAQELEINTAFIDTISPDLILKDMVMPLGIDGKLPILFPEDFVVAADDNCGDRLTIYPEQILLNCQHIGHNNITVIAIDDMGNRTIDSFDIEVIDVDEPLIFCTKLQTINSCDTVFYDDPFVFDNCGDIQIDLIEGPASGTVFPEGVNHLVFQATDIGGNTTTCKSTFYVDYGIDYQITSFDASCHDSMNGALAIQSSSQNGPSEYDILNYDGDLLNMPVGSYPISFTDSLGCEVIDTAIISSPDPILISNIQIIHPQDFNGTNGWIDIHVLGGVAPYRFTWYQNGQIISQDQNPQNLTAGSYTVKIRDSYQCEFLSHVIELGQTTSTENLFDSKDVQVFPNPASDKFHVSMPADYACDYIQIFTITGQLINTHFCASEITSIDLGGYERGTYILKLKIGSEFIHKRVIIMD